MLKYKIINCPVDTIDQEKHGRKKGSTELIKGEYRLCGVRVETRLFENISKTAAVDFINQ